MDTESALYRRDGFFFFWIGRDEASVRSKSAWMRYTPIVFLFVCGDIATIIVLVHALDVSELGFYHDLQKRRSGVSGHIELRQSLAISCLLSYSLVIRQRFSRSTRAKRSTLSRTFPLKILIGGFSSTIRQQRCKKRYTSINFTKVKTPQ